MLKQIVLICAIVLVQQCNSAAATECYTCTNTSSLPECKTTVRCPEGAVCASEYTTINGSRVYNLGCRDQLACPRTPTINPGSSIIGRASTTHANCSECCHSNFCNRQLCQDADIQCTDDQSYDCASFGAITDICDDASHIKSYCRRFCGFCNTVDGGWSNWGQWSQCSVTCENGTRARSRSCSDPAPANSGSDCSGAKKELLPCTEELCPVHGGWSSWSGWGSCSASCDIGLQHRDRTCSKPYPARNGNHCFGVSREDNICLPGACANGGWSSWGQWGTCTMTCGGGIKTRGRNCNNPTPSIIGQYCIGDSSEAMSCNASPCYSIGFSVTKPWGISSGVMLFSKIITNTGSSYNSATGVFTCRIPGYYFFSASLLKNDAFTGTTKCHIRKNGANLVKAFTQPGADPHKGWTAAGTSVYVHLDAGDEVTLGECTVLSSWDTEDGSSYAGFLITPDAV